MNHHLLGSVVLVIAEDSELGSNLLPTEPAAAAPVGLLDPSVASGPAM